MTDLGAGPDPRRDGDRATRVQAMFSDIAPTYDLLNGVLSLGVDRRWRAQAAHAALANVPVGGSAVLDVATGTGDLAFTIKGQRPDVRVVGADFAAPMLELARGKAAKRGVAIEFVQADGTALPYPDGSFDAVTIAYGLRNFADPDAGLREFRRVLKPCGRLVILEFPPPPVGFFGAIFRFYFTRVLPRLGGIVSGAPGAYAYLPESVLAFFTPAALEVRLRAAGFAAVEYRLQTFGISALHVADASSSRSESDND
ncbi:MAG TPA: bifunctional demethylmenaquinone methyltransferase/2-methoxy-6-polyprenyl-1,4-benzoquinol methylase UbiE [Trueperaceae bacterium]|nr:bifunctional demethylmenaquinone methyltransferase/2-methoxy-6-polyprenyl-1,4-benzoquinol methylase UbiE [Trueperaceae bacterium]